MISNSVVLYVEAVECKSSTKSVWYVGVGIFAQLLGKGFLVSGRLWCEQHWVIHVDV